MIDRNRIFHRLLVCAPERTMQHAADAVMALLRGNLCPLIYDFGVARVDALQMLQETWASEDTVIGAYQAVEGYLDRLGVVRLP